MGIFNRRSNILIGGIIGAIPGAIIVQVLGGGFKNEEDSGTEMSETVYEEEESTISSYEEQNGDAYSDDIHTNNPENGMNDNIYSNAANNTYPESYYSEDANYNDNNGSYNYDISSFCGDWSDDISQRCNMTISRIDESRATITVYWGNSAFSTSYWSLSGEFNQDTNILSYTGIEYTEDYDENGTASINDYRYGLSGYFSFDEQNNLRWSAEDGCIFSKSGEAKQYSAFA